jgi:hypothetical protein
MIQWIIPSDERRELRRAAAATDGTWRQRREAVKSVQWTDLSA